ncbi:hypothetical protein FRC00_012345 [Tulasnella sp. 408]|nr:hypothetical protein FRC00_012345 [Tulasnella sp. 408]
MFAPKPRANITRRQTLPGGLTADQPIEIISSSDEGPAKKKIKSPKIQTIYISDSDDNMDLDPPSAPKSAPLPAKKASFPKAPTVVSTGQPSSSSRPAAQAPLAAASSTIFKGKASADRPTQWPGPSTLRGTQRTGAVSQPGPSRGVDQPGEHSTAQSIPNGARGSIGSSLLASSSATPGSTASGAPRKLSKPVQNLAKEMVSLGLEPRPPSGAQPSQKGKVPSTVTSKQASPQRPLFHPPTPPQSRNIEELTQNFEALASPSNKTTEGPIVKVSDSPEKEIKLLAGKASPAGPEASKASNSPSPLKHRQTARKSAYRSSAFVPKPKRQSSSPEELSEDPIQRSTTASKMTKTTVTSVPIPGSDKRETTVETTVVQKTTMRTTNEPDNSTDDEFFKTTTHASRSPSPHRLRRPTSPKQRKTDEGGKDRPVTSYTQETASRRSRVTVQNDVSGSKVVSTVEDEELTTSVQRRPKPRRKARQKPVITSLKQQTLDAGRPWHNPFYDEPRRAVPLDSDLADSMNQHISGLTEDLTRRGIFEEMIRTRDRGAPPITIVNDVDKEPCPPFEFDWTNEMLYGEGVPRKDKDLKGLFADEFIPTGRFIGVYAGELLTDEEAHNRGLLYDKLGRTYLFNLDFVHLRDNPSSQKPPGSRESSATADSDKSTWTSKYAVDAFHAGNHTRFLNHSCDPNIELYPIYTDDADLDKPLLCAFTCKNVQRGEELCFSYHSEEGEGEPQRDFSGEEALVRGRCLCGAANCKGYMFRYSNMDDDEEEQQEENEEGGESGDAMET